MNRAWTGPPGNVQPDDFTSMVSSGGRRERPRSDGERGCREVGRIKLRRSADSDRDVVEAVPPEQLALIAPGVAASLALHPAVSAPPVDEAVVISVALAGPIARAANAARLVAVSSRFRIVFPLQRMSRMGTHAVQHGGNMFCSEIVTLQDQ